MSNQKLTARTELSATPAGTDILYIVDDPGGTPLSKKITVDNVIQYAAADTMTFTNKTFDANATGNSLSNVETADIASGSKSGSDSKLITGTAGTASNLAIWNGDGDLVDGPTPPSGTIVGTSDTQTLTNKTLTSPVINVTSDAEGDVYYRDASGNFARLAPGTSGKYLKTQGASNPPMWDTPGGGGDMLASTYDAASITEQLVGLTATQTLSNKTLTTPKIATGGSINDAGGDEYLKFTEDTTPVTYIEITSGDSGVAPQVSGAGETNTDLHLHGSGTGNVYLSDGTDTTKDLNFELSGATTAKTMTITSSHTDDRTLTLPDTTDTLVGKATTDTLTNKTLTSPVLNTGVSGTAVKDEDNMASNSATHVCTQQSIKAYVDNFAGSSNITTVGTVTSGTLSTGAVLAGVTMTLGSDADGDIYYRSSNVLTRLAKGTASQVLTMNAGATAPEWAAAAGGSFWTDSGKTDTYASATTFTNSGEDTTGIYTPGRI